MCDKTPIIELKGITKCYKTTNHKEVVLKDLDFTFREGIRTSILGSSGCGKTTLLNLIGGIDSDFIGDLLYRGEAIKDFDNYRRDAVSFIFQDLNLIGHLDLIKNITIGITNDVINKEEKARELLDKVGLLEHIHKKPHQLSGGEKQRVAIARALARDTDILLCDEPTGNLDETTKEEIMDLIVEVFKDKTVIFITHDEEVALQYSDIVLKIIDGKIIIFQNKIDDHLERASKKTIKNSKKDFNRRFQVNLLSKKLSLFNATYLLVIIAAIFIFGTGVVEKVEDEIDGYLIEKNKVDLIKVSSKYTPDGVEGFINDFNKEYNNLAKGYMLTLTIKTRLLNSSKTQRNRINSIPPSAKSTIEKDIVAGRFPETNNEILYSKGAAIKKLYTYYVNEYTNGYLFKRNKAYRAFEDILGYSDEKLLEEISKIDISYRNTYKFNPDRVYDQELTIVGILDDEKYHLQTSDLLVAHSVEETIYKTVTTDIYFLEEEFWSYRGRVYLANNEVRFRFFHVFIYEENLDLRKEIFDSLILFKPILFGRDSVTIQRKAFYDRIYGYKIAINGGCAILSIFAMVSLYNNIRISIIKNRKHIGIYKSLGYTRWNVKMMFLLEGVIISVYVIGTTFITWFIINKLLNVSIIKAFDPTGLLELSNILHLNMIATVGSVITIVFIVLISINRELGKVKIVKLLRE